MAWTPKAMIQVATDLSMAVTTLDEESQFRAAIQSVVDLLISAAIAADPTLAAGVEAAADAAVTEKVAELRVPLMSVPAAAQPLIVRAANQALTWLQAEGYVDPAAGIALPTENAAVALTRKGFPRVTAGDGELVIRGANKLETWLRAAGYVHPSTGIAGPSDLALKAMSVAGVAVVYRTAPPTTLDLQPGEVRIYLNDGDPVLAIGE